VADATLFGRDTPEEPTQIRGRSSGGDAHRGAAAHHRGGEARLALSAPTGTLRGAGRCQAAKPSAQLYRSADSMTKFIGFFAKRTQFPKMESVSWARRDFAVRRGPLRRFRASQLAQSVKGSPLPRRWKIAPQYSHETPTRSDSGYSPMSGAKADLNGECPRTMVMNRHDLSQPILPRFNALNSCDNWPLLAHPRMRHFLLETRRIKPNLLFPI
jgi:hypothetical protein